MAGQIKPADRVQVGDVLVRVYQVQSQPGETVRHLRTVEAVTPFLEDGKPKVHIRFSAHLFLTVKPSDLVTVHQEAEMSVAA